MTEETTKRSPGWYRGGAGGHDLWQWWDGERWKPLEPGDEAAANKAYNRRASGWIMGGAALLVFVLIVWQAVASGVS